MKTPTSIHISAIERLYNDGFTTNEEYKAIMLRIVLANVSAKEGEKNG